MYRAGAVDGVVTNQTTGKPQGGATVTLIELGSGMKNVGSVVERSRWKVHVRCGHCRRARPTFCKPIRRRATTDRMLPPGSPGTGVTVDVFNSAAKVKGADVSQDMFLLEPTGSEMVVSERIVFTNTAKLTFQDPNGTIQILCAEEVTVRVTGTGSVRKACRSRHQQEKGPDANTYVIRYAIKPGRRTSTSSYTLPYDGNGEAKFV